MNNEIEVLIMLNIPPDNFLNSLSKTQLVQNLNLFYSKKPQTTKKNVFYLSHEYALIESRLLFFLYTYITYVHIDPSHLKKESLISLWTSVMKFYRVVANSKNPNTIFWLLELLFLLSKKYSPKEALGDSHLKKALHQEINNLLQSAAGFCAKAFQVFFNDPNLLMKGKEGANPNSYTFVQPFSPTIYELYKNYVGKLETHKSEFVEGGEFMKIETLLFGSQLITEDELYKKYRLAAFKTLKKIGLQILQNTYSPEKTDRIVLRARAFMDLVFPIMENKSKENEIYLECASELLHALLENARGILIKEFKKPILDIFLGNDFFKCSKYSLKLWSKIIDWVVTFDKSDLFSEFLNKVSSFASFFSKDSETKQRIKNFERICFVIYSGDLDRYENKLNLLLEKTSEVIKNSETSPPPLLILVLFCMRILILRLSAKTLNTLFKNIWPVLLSLLIQILSKKSNNMSSNNAKNPNLVLSALKLIELISIVQFDDFYLHQWMFVFDYFGLKIEQTADLRSEFDKAPAFLTPFEFEPYIVNCLPGGFKINYINKQYPEEVQTDYKKRHRQIIMTNTKVENESEMHSRALELCQYLIVNNEFRSVVDPNEIENWIEEDFISLDDYIHKI